MKNIVNMKFTINPIRDNNEYVYELLMDGKVIGSGNLTINPNWISVEDRLPKGCNKGFHKLFIVSVNYEKTFSYYAWFDGDEFYSADFGGNIHPLVTHWMPLPEPPEEK